MSNAPVLHVVMYHYVRDFNRTRFPDIKGMQLEDFRSQVSELRQRFEMATVESSLAFLHGAYRPARDLCLLTFDDGLREHFDTVTPILEERGIQGVFFVVTSCLEDARVASVHMNHFLTARLGFETYRELVMERVRYLAPDLLPVLDHTHGAARITYPWDTADVAQFKYFFNFVMDAARRDQLASLLFAETFGCEAQFARELYVNWEELQAMQCSGMAIGGHTHAHRALATMPDAELADDLSLCRALLDARLQPQSIWPFSYPFGKKSSFKPSSAVQLKDLRFDCAFSTETGSNVPRSDLFCLRRVDCKNAPA